MFRDYYGQDTECRSVGVGTTVENSLSRRGCRCNLHTAGVSNTLCRSRPRGYGRTLDK